MFWNNSFGRHSNVECGLVHILPGSNSGQFTFGPFSTGNNISNVQRTVPIPLQSVSAVAYVMHAVGQVELTQVYVNKETQPIEAIYYFPVDSNGGVTDFRAELEGRTIKGVVKPQEEAKAQYETAVQQKQTAFLVESNKPDIFKVRVGFLKPGAQVKIVIGYVTEVKNEKGSNAMRFFIPTTIAPRYNPGGIPDQKTQDLRNMTFSESSPAPLSLTVNVAIQGKIKDIHSPSHRHQVKIVQQAPMATKENWTWVVATLSGNYIVDMDRDFVLLVTPEEIHAPRLYSEKTETSTALMTHLIPSFNLEEQKVELFFVLDRSVSMNGSSIQLAKRALNLFLHSLPMGCYFNIVGFGSTYQFLFPQSAKYDDYSLRHGIRHAQDLRADLGGTEILQPLEYIFSINSIPGYLRQIFVLTDGEITNTDQVIGMCQANAHKCRVFALGIGDGASHHLVEGLAEAGGGTAEFVTANETMDAKVLQQLKNAIQPSLTNVRVKWTGLPDCIQTGISPVEVNREKTLLGYGKPVSPNEPTFPDREIQKTFWGVPEKIQPIFDGSQLLVFGVFSGKLPTGVEIVAESPDGPLSIHIKLSEENAIGSTGLLHKLAAIKAVRELEMKVSRLAYRPYGSPVQTFSLFPVRLREEPRLIDLKSEIIKIACQYGLASRYSSFVAVDSQSESKVEEYWMMQSRYVPSQIPNSYGNHGRNGNNYGGFGPQQLPRVFFAFGAPSVQPAGLSHAPTSAFSFGGASNQPQLTTFGASTTLFGGSSRSSHSTGGLQPQQNNSSLFGSTTGSSGHSPFGGWGTVPDGLSSSSGFGSGSTFGQSGNVTSGFGQSQPTQFSFASDPPFTFGSAASGVPQSSNSTFSGLAPQFGGTSNFASPPNFNFPKTNAANFDTNSEFYLHALIATQSFNGSFPLSAEFCNVIRQPLEKMQQEAKSYGLDKEVWATALAIIFLKENLPKLKDSWELIDLKARKWLEKNFGKDIEPILRAATEILKSLPRDDPTL